MSQARSTNIEEICLDSRQDKTRQDSCSLQRPCRKGGGGGPCRSPEFTKILCLCRNLRKGGWPCVVKKPLQFCNFAVNISRIQRTCVPVHRHSQLTQFTGGSTETHWQETLSKAQGNLTKISSSWQSDWWCISQTNVLCHLFSALPSLSQFGRRRLSLVAISFYALSLLFGPRRLSEFALAGPLYIIMNTALTV